MSIITNSNGRTIAGAVGSSEYYSTPPSAVGSIDPKMQRNEMMDKTTATFVSTLLHSATLTHLMHFKTKSYSEHMALGAYYDAIPDLVDSLVESIQGAYEMIVDPYPSMFGNGNGTDPLAYMISLRNYVRDYRGELPQDSEIQNEVDNIANLLNQTVYKLKFLK